MSSDWISNIVLGYGGGCRIVCNGVTTDVTCTSCSFSKSVTWPTFSPSDLPYSTSREYQRAAVLVGYGTTVYNGSISFEFSQKAVSNLISSNFLKRNAVFEFYVSDGHSSYRLRGCRWNSFSISAQPHSLVTGSIGFSSNNNRLDSSEIDSNWKPSDIFDTSPVNYWNVGRTGVESFNIAISQDVVPVYLNSSPANGMDVSTPDYFRCGFINIEMNISSWDDWLSYKSVNLADRKISISNAAVSDLSFSTGGQNDTGTHSYSCRGVNLKRSSDTLFKIESR